MNFTGQKFHFIGVGGAGMAPLAELCAARGVSVSGSDSAPNGKTARLERLGVTVHCGHREEHLPDDATLTIYSSAVPPDNPERRKAARLGIPELRRGEFLAGYASGFRRVAAVSGSHGKTSITALLVRMMEAAGAAPGYLIGA